MIRSCLCEVKKPERIKLTVRSKPERDGCSGARFLGPIKDYEVPVRKVQALEAPRCYCFAKKCGVEVALASCRRRSHGSHRAGQPR